MLFCCSLCQAKTEVKQSFLDFMGIFLKSILNYLIPNIVFDFTAGRLSENAKVLLQWIYDFCLQQRCNRNTLAANIGPCNLKLVLEQYFEL